MLKKRRDWSPGAVRVRLIATLLMLPVLASAQSKPQNAFLGPLLNQKMVLMHLGEQKEYHLSKSGISKLTSHCDVAVKLKTAEWTHGTARLLFEDFGSPSFSGGVHISANSYAPACKMVNDSITVHISGFSPAEDEDSVLAVLGQVLMTPEEYMALHGVGFNFPSAPDDQAAMQCGPPMKMPMLLFSVSPELSDEARRAKYQGTTVIAIVVGTDGHVHNPQIIRKLGMGLDEMALEALPMWRFEPGRDGDKAVACKLNVEISFRLY